jgi:hypothetical protein
MPFIGSPASFAGGAVRPICPKGAISVSVARAAHGGTTAGTRVAGDRPRQHQTFYGKRRQFGEPTRNGRVPAPGRRLGYWPL